MRELRLYRIDADYLKFLHSIDSRVSIKFNTRPYVGIIVMVTDKPYLIPLTSKTTEVREAMGRKKRSPKVTTFVKDSKGNEIANLLHNNMIPIVEGMYEELKIDVEVNTYELNEIRFIRKHSSAIINKAKAVHRRRISNRDSFLNKICCDFSLLEKECEGYICNTDTTDTDKTHK